MPLDRKTLRSRRLIFLSLVALLALAAGLFFLIRWNTHDRFYVTTDNAFVVGNIIPVQADATGVVADVLVEETNKVKAGDLLVRLDEQRAKAALDQSAADLARAVRAVGGQFAARRQACQKIASQIALRDKTRHDVMRYRQALPSGSVSQQVLQNAVDQLASLEAELHESRADYQSFEARLGGLSLTNHPDIEAAKAKFAENYIEFARQRIKAPVSGYVAKRKAQVGDRARPGDLLMQIIPLDYLWIEANLWENSMERVRPGQPVTITVDLYGNSQCFTAGSRASCRARAASSPCSPPTMRPATSSTSSSASRCISRYVPTSSKNSRCGQGFPPSSPSTCAMSINRPTPRSPAWIPRPPIPKFSPMKSPKPTRARKKSSAKISSAATPPSDHVRSGTSGRRAGITCCKRCYGRARGFSRMGATEKRGKARCAARARAPDGRFVNAGAINGAVGVRHAQVYRSKLIEALIAKTARSGPTSPGLALRPARLTLASQSRHAVAPGVKGRQRSK